MNAARWRISGIGESVYEWKRLSSVRTCLLVAAGSLSTSFLDPKAVAACAKLDEDRVIPSVLGVLTARLAGLAGFPVCTVRAVVDGAATRGAHRFAVVRAHCRHMVLSAARAAESIDGAIASQLFGQVVLPMLVLVGKEEVYYKGSLLDR